MTDEEQARSILVGLGGWRVGDRCILHIDPKHKGYAGTIESLWPGHGGELCTVLVDAGVCQKEPIHLSAYLDELTID